MLGDRTQEQRVPEPEADPGDAEDRDRDRHRQRLPGIGNAFEDERHRDRAQEAGRHPRNPAELSAEQSEHRAGVARQHERSQRPCDPIELVERDQRRHECEYPEPPAAEIDQPEHRRQEHGADDDP